MHILSKTTYIKGLQCPKYFYLTKKRPYLRDKLSFEQRAIFKRGTDVGVLARTFFPNGENMAPSSPALFDKKRAETLANVNNPNVNVMYEAVFQYDDTLIMLDILVRDGDKWRAIEVKSSLAVSETYVNDAALQYYVLKGNGLDISDVEIMYLNSEYVRQGEVDLNKLFLFKSVKDVIETKQDSIRTNISKLKKLLDNAHSPQTSIGIHCHRPYNCDFIGTCWKNVDPQSFLHVTSLPDSELFGYYESGITENKMFERQVSDEATLNQLDALKNDTYFIDYNTLFSSNTAPKAKTAFLSILVNHPAVPEFNDFKPYDNYVLAFNFMSDTRNFTWDCMDDHTKHPEWISVLADAAEGMERIVCFFPQKQLNSVLDLKNDRCKELLPKIFNLGDVLTHAGFYHKNIKHEFSLQRVFEAVFAKEKLFEHGRILFNATSNNPLDFDMARNDLQSESESMKRLYEHFFHPRANSV